MCFLIKDVLADKAAESSCLPSTQVTFVLETV